MIHEPTQQARGRWRRWRGLWLGGAYVGFVLSLPVWLIAGWAIVVISNSWEYNGPSPRRSWLALAVFTYPVWEGGLLTLAAVTRKRPWSAIPLAIATLPLVAAVWVVLSFLYYAF